MYSPVLEFSLLKGEDEHMYSPVLEFSLLNGNSRWANTVHTNNAKCSYKLKKQI